MARMSTHHQKLTDGVGKCSVPMWIQGCPAGFCDKPAYGERPPGEEFRIACTGEMRRFDGKYNGYIPGLACVIHGGPEKPHECSRCGQPNPDYEELDGCRDPDCPELQIGEGIDANRNPLD